MDHTRRIMRIGMTLLLAAAFLFSAGAEVPAALTPAPQGVFVPMDAVVRSPHSLAVNLTNFADDYGTPQAFFFNGTPVKVVAVEKTMGDYPPEFADPAQLWARVVIGKTEASPGVEGMMPLAALDFTGEPVAEEAPSAVPAKGSAVELFADNGLTGTAVASLPAGTPIAIIGWMKDWAQVSAAGHLGFVRQGELEMDAAARSRIDGAMPAGFDEIQPGYQQKYDAFMNELSLLYETYGDSNIWPLEVKAEASALAARHGFLFTDTVHVMPGEGDLTQEEAVRLAKAAMLSRHGMGGEAWEDVSLSFYHPPEDEESKEWRVNLWAKPGYQNSVVWLSRKGEVQRTLVNESVEAGQGELTPEELQAALEESMRSLSYYLYGIADKPREGDLDKEAAQRRAFEIFTSKEEEKPAETYRTEAEYFRNDDDTRRWWLVNIYDTSFPEGMQPVYQVALVMPDGDPAYFTEHDFYADEIIWLQQYLEFDRLEKERGPYAFWTLEQKAAWDPEYSGLPGQGDIPQEEALRRATEAVEQAYPGAKDRLPALKPAFFFSTYQSRNWQIVFLQPDLDARPTGDEYFVILDAKTGDILDVSMPEQEYEE